MSYEKEQVEPPEWFSRFPDKLQRFLVELGAPENWAEGRYPSEAPEWAQWGGLGRGLGFLAPIAKAIPKLGNLPLAGTLAPSYMYGMYETAYRAGWIAPSMGGFDWTYQGEQMGKVGSYAYHLGRMAAREFSSEQYKQFYAPEGQRQAAMSLYEARMAYWGASQEFAPAQFAWGAERLISYLGGGGAGVIRAYGFPFTSATSQMVHGGAMLPFINEAMRYDPEYTKQALRESTSFWPFQYTPFSDEVIGGLAEWTGIQMAAMVIPAALRPATLMTFPGGLARAFTTGTFEQGILGGMGPGFGYVGTFPKLGIESASMPSASAIGAYPPVDWMVSGGKLNFIYQTAAQRFPLGLDPMTLGAAPSPTTLGYEGLFGYTQIPGSFPNLPISGGISTKVGLFPNMEYNPMTNDWSVSTRGLQPGWQGLSERWGGLQTDVRRGVTQVPSPLETAGGYQQLSRRQAVWGAVKDIVPVGFMQAGLGLMMAPLSTMALRYAAKQPIFESEMEMYGNLATVGVGAGFFGAGAYARFVAGWGTTAVGGLGGALGWLGLEAQAVSTAARLVDLTIYGGLGEEEYQRRRQQQIEAHKGWQGYFMTGLPLSIPTAEEQRKKFFAGAPQLVATLEAQKRWSEITGGGSTDWLQWATGQKIESYTSQQITDIKLAEPTWKLLTSLREVMDSGDSMAALKLLREVKQLNPAVYDEANMIFKVTPSKEAEFIKNMKLFDPIGYAGTIKYFEEHYPAEYEKVKGEDLINRVALNAAWTRIREETAKFMPFYEASDLLWQTATDLSSAYSGAGIAYREKRVGYAAVSFLEKLTDNAYDLIDSMAGDDKWNAVRKDVSKIMVAAFTSVGLTEDARVADVTPVWGARKIPKIERAKPSSYFIEMEEGKIWRTMWGGPLTRIQRYGPARPTIIQMEEGAVDVTWPTSVKTLDAIYSAVKGLGWRGAQEKFNWLRDADTLTARQASQMYTKLFKEEFDPDRWEPSAFIREGGGGLLYGLPDMFKIAAQDKNFADLLTRTLKGELTYDDLTSETYKYYKKDLDDLRGGGTVVEEGGAGWVPPSDSSYMVPTGGAYPSSTLPTYKPSPYEEGGVIPAQHGLNRLFTRPTKILVAERGPEWVTVDPAGRSGTSKLRQIVREELAAAGAGKSLDELDWELSPLISKRIMRGITARGV